ncbi:Putative disease resistance RPP13-like protein 1-like [Zea mays]|uniref:Disease resistance RPP13-like protein 1 n=1 Tax=Zea mays TaxID=4577 RepID=C0PEA3_MAIZE|nr:Putative disease resistance RPP13-like protein 1-like [Zea mays]ACN33519.1 unknown [Zea mays]|eukprot:NP_001169355.1 uncharacterized protein LOC100383222 [Zea mays]
MDNNGEKTTTIIHTLRDALLHFAVKSKKLASPLLEPFGRATEPTTVNDDELMALKSKLRRIRATLRDAESLSVTDCSVQLWLAELGDLENRAEDVVEELEYESRRSAQLEELKQDLLYAATTRKQRREVALLFAPPPARRLRRKIDDVWARYEEIASDRKTLRLRPGDGGCAPRPAASPLVPSSVLPRTERLHGRHGDVERVAALVLGDPDGGTSYAVVPIVGMAGVGKTALMQHVCGMETVKSCFELTRWVWVSQDFDVVSVTRKIVEAITRSRPECGELSTLHELIVEHLAGKRCLIVLDDVWDDNPSHWNSLTAPLSHCAPGSAVAVTTRSNKVARMVSTKVYHLKCLSDEDCWLVCQRRALPNSGANVHKELVEIGERIAKKCHGLPLAAEAAGSVLSTSAVWEHWNEVLNNDLWADNEVKNLVLPVLKVSYDHLSMPLKRSFAFCSLFPKGFVFDKDLLVQLWTAQGFVDAEGDCSLEAIANGYFNDLVSRCFFHPSPSHALSEGKFVMHDLYQELAQFVSGNECRMIQLPNSTKIDESSRHLSLVDEESDSVEEINLSWFCGHRDLRTFMFIARTEQNPEEMTFRTKIPSELITGFECLRALDLSNSNIMELPKSIGSLIHLRFLGLDNTAIQMLPESICALLHLQTIKLNHCSSLTQLPQGIKLLLNLRCLEIPHSGIKMPSGIGELTRLQRLPFFAIENEPAGCTIADLNELVNLEGHLHITGLNNLDGAQASIANLWNKPRIKSLTLEWSGVTNFSKSLCDPQGNAVSCISDSQHPAISATADQVLNCLKPHSNLEELSIKGYNGSFSRSWLGWLPLDRLASIELKDCRNCKEVPPLGCLPSLKHILIQSLPSVKLIGPEFFGNAGDTTSNIRSRICNVFPALKSLKFSNMEAWEEWLGVKSEHFPNLKYFSIVRCSKLKLLPKFTSEPKLKIRYCDLLQMPLCQNPVKHIPAKKEISYTCIAEGDILVLEASCSYGA